VKRRGPSAPDRLRQTAALLRSEGIAGVSDRLRNRVANRIRPANLAKLPVSAAHFAQASQLATAGWQFPSPMPWSIGEPLKVGWICTPPAAGSGGHTTIFRMVGALERAGHHCDIYISDEHGWSIRQHRESVRRWWPWVQAEVRDITDGVDDCHAIFATGWTTAWSLLTLRAAGARCYFVQDFEPSFYPAGSEYFLAEDTYRFPLYAVTAGRWLASHLAGKYGTDTRYFDFGCDVERYRLEPEYERAGICYYCRPTTPRRAHELAVAALRLFAEANPEVVIHTYGEDPGRLPFPFRSHGLLTPAELNRLYNSCVAGLVLSATNVSLVPHEMLAAGCIPVVNDGEQNRIVLDNPNVVYCTPMPHEIALQLGLLVSRPHEDSLRVARAAASSVELSGWSQAEEQFIGAVEQIVAAAGSRAGHDRRCTSVSQSTLALDQEVG
jgi:O-antigen biosynthesis protein